MITRSIFVAFIISGVVACTTPGTYFIYEGPSVGYVEYPRPAVTQVTFKENPYTTTGYSPDYPQSLKGEIDKIDPCIGRALTEDEVKEYFRVAEVLQPYESSSFNYGRCHVYGHVVLKDGRTASFSIDLNRLGRLETSDGLTIDYYCNNCQNEKFEEACDRECLQEAAK